jgi:hypothetical protein
MRDVPHGGTDDSARKPRVTRWGTRWVRDGVVAPGLAGAGRVRARRRLIRRLEARVAVLAGVPFLAVGLLEVSSASATGGRSPSIPARLSTDHRRSPADLTGRSGSSTRSVTRSVGSPPVASAPRRSDKLDRLPDRVATKNGHKMGTPSRRRQRQPKQRWMQAGRTPHVGAQ